MKKLMLAGMNLEELENAEDQAREAQAARSAHAKRERAHRKVLRDLANQGRTFALIANTIAPGVPMPIEFESRRQVR
jgi:hypothetical protein